jgi:hypothetical protein
MFDVVIEELVALPDRVLGERIEALELRRRATEASSLRQSRSRAPAACMRLTVIGR